MLMVQPGGRYGRELEGVVVGKGNQGGFLQEGVVFEGNRELVHGGGRV